MSAPSRRAHNFIDLAGQRFGKLTAISFHPERDSRGQVKWLCRCDCGNEFVAVGSNLRSGATSHCGCLSQRGLGSGPLRSVLDAACVEEGCNLSTLTVLSQQNDPYRFGTPGDHEEARWIVEQISKAFRPDQHVHLCSFHCALVAQGNVRKPDGQVYINTAADDGWLGLAMKAARWLGYLDFERISDNRNEDPTPYRNYAPTLNPVARVDAGAWLSVEAFGVSALAEQPVHILAPYPRLEGFHRAQPNAIAIFGEKSSLKEVLDPIAQRYEADLYLGAGETSDTLLHRMAKDAG
jgi:hypothetical protein